MCCRKYLFFFLLIVLLASCNDADKRNTSNHPGTNADSSSTTTPSKESRETLFYHQTMDVHNEVMAKMSKLIGYQKKVQQQSDSIRSMLAATDFPRQLAQRISRQLDTLQVLGQKLEAADSAMNAWMEQFNPDPKLASSDANADYFEKQKMSAEAMKKQFFEALQEAENFYSRQ